MSCGQSRGVDGQADGSADEGGGDVNEAEDGELHGWVAGVDLVVGVDWLVGVEIMVYV